MPQFTSRKYYDVIKSYHFLFQCAVFNLTTQIHKINIKENFFSMDNQNSYI